MRHRGHYLAITVVGVALLLVSAAVFLEVKPAEAQCGSQASSCKNCHETQSKDPVNADGTAWHESHAFGDFCYICHGGNNQSTDETAAHLGMVDPMADIQAACGQCHPNDLQARANVYATQLGVTASLGGPLPTQSAPVTTPTVADPAPGDQPAASEPVGMGSTQIVDYVARYNETALHRGPTNWGNVVLLVMIGGMLVGGGALVLTREGLVRISIRDSKPLESGLPADVADMAPRIAKLKPGARKALSRLLDEPDAMAEVLTSIDKLAESRSPDDTQKD